MIASKPRKKSSRGGGEHPNTGGINEAVERVEARWPGLKNNRWISVETDEHRYLKQYCAEHKIVFGINGFDPPNPTVYANLLFEAYANETFEAEARWNVEKNVSYLYSNITEGSIGKILAYAKEMSKGMALKGLHGCTAFKRVTNKQGWYDYTETCTDAFIDTCASMCYCIVPFDKVEDVMKEGETLLLQATLKHQYAAMQRELGDRITLQQYAKAKKLGAAEFMRRVRAYVDAVSISSVKQKDGKNQKKGSVKVCANCGKISSTLMQCANCKQVWYCNKNCQKKQWKVHKLKCEKEVEDADLSGAHMDPLERWFDNDKVKCTESFTNESQSFSGEGGGADECAICLELLHEHCHQLPCGHVFHQSCIRDLRKHHTNEAELCPSCRTPLPAGPAESYYHATIWHDRASSAVISGIPNTYQEHPAYLSKAEKLTRQAIFEDSMHFQSHALLGSVLRMKGDYEGAITSCRRSVEINPMHASGFINLSLALSASLKGWVESLQVSKRAIELEPNNELVYHNIAAHLTCTHTTVAAAFIDKALSIRPNDADSHGLRGMQFLMQGNAATALESLRRAVEINPKNAISHLVMGAIYEKQHKYVAAIAECVVALQCGGRIAEGFTDIPRSIIERCQRTRKHKTRREKGVVLKGCWQLGESGLIPWSQDSADNLLIAHANSEGVTPLQVQQSVEQLQQAMAQVAREMPDQHAVDVD
jgi:tetratricopeptide (TPR) repeat protein